MRRSPRWFSLGSWSVFGAVLLAASAGAETVTLALNQLEPLRSGLFSGATSDYIYRNTYPQHFFVQTGQQVHNPDAPDFSEVVKKEPEKYSSANPFRCVARLGRGIMVLSWDSKEGKPNAYPRLYFDRNHNGDLTDEEVIEADDETSPGIFGSRDYWQGRFSCVTVTLDVDGTQVPYAFSLRVYSNWSDNYSYINASLNAAAYREGEITLEGNTHHVAILDFNSNGRFDDKVGVREDGSAPNGQVYPKYGDMLLVDPNNKVLSNPYDVTASKERRYVSNMVNIDGRYYDMEVSPAGDKLTLTQSTKPLGYITNPNALFRAVVYGDQGVLKISGTKSEPVPVPVGRWKLLAYTIDEPRGEQDAEPLDQDRDVSLLERLSGAFFGAAADVLPLSGPNRVSAYGTHDYEVVTVDEGEAVAMPFGPPYHPLVKVSYRQGPDLVSLELLIVGSTGEICNDLSVNGRRPKDPHFTILDPEGQEIETGEFEYG